MTTMIEKMAQEIFKKDEHWCRLGADVWETAPELQKTKCRNMARAALTALLEPSEAMLQSGFIEVYDIARATVPKDLAKGRVSRSFAAMIRTALDEVE